MSFQSRIDDLYNAGTLVVGYIPSSQSQLDEIDRTFSNGASLTHYVVDPSIPPPVSGEGLAVRTGWITGADSDLERGAEGGLALFRFKEMKGQYGSPGVSHRFGRGHTMSFQWAERYSASFIGFCSQTDTGFRGGVKTLMIEHENLYARADGGHPQNTLWGYTTNSVMEIVFTSDNGTLPESARNPSQAVMGLYGTYTHAASSFVNQPGFVVPPRSLRGYRPDKWVVYTVQIDLGSTWGMRFNQWHQDHTPGLLHPGTDVPTYVLEDFRMTDERWTKSTAQINAYNAGDAVALRAAPVPTGRPHRVRFWGQYEDQAEPWLARDCTVMIPNNGSRSEEPTLNDEVHYGSCNWSTLAYLAGDPSGTNWYKDPVTGVRDRYTPYHQGKRWGIDSFPDRFGPAATHPINKWYGPMIIARQALNPKFYGEGSGETPPVLPSSVMIPAGIQIVGTP